MRLGCTWIALLLLLSASGLGQSSGDNRGIVEGKVTTQLGYPLADVWVSVIETGGEGRSFQSRPDGSFWIELPAGIYSVTARYEKSELYKKKKIKNLKLNGGGKLTLDIVLSTSSKALRDLKLSKSN